MSIPAEAAIDAIPQPVALLDAQGGVIHANRAWRESEELAPLLSIPDAMAGLLESLGLAAADEPQENGRSAAEAPPEGEFPIYLATTILDARLGLSLGRVADASPPLYLLTLLERLPLEDDEEDEDEPFDAESLLANLGEAIGRLEAADAADDRIAEDLEELLHVVSHDLKAPLVTIGGLVGMLREDLGSKLDEETLETFSMIEASVVDLRRLIDRLLEVSRAGRVPENPRPVSLDELVRDVWSERAGAFRDEGFEVAIEPDLPEVAGDAERLRGALAHVFDNALEYAGGVDRPELSVAARRDEDVVELLVRDRGPGLAEDERCEAIKLFNRAGRDRDPDHPGLGLAVVARTLAAHGGALRLEPAAEGEEGRGLTVRLLFPAG